MPPTASPTLCQPAVRMVVVVGYMSYSEEGDERIPAVEIVPVLALTSYRNEVGDPEWDVVFDGKECLMSGREYERENRTLESFRVVACPWDEDRDPVKLGSYIVLAKEKAARLYAERKEAESKPRPRVLDRARAYLESRPASS